MDEVDLVLEGSPLHFLSDAHLGSTEGPTERERWLLDCLADLRQESAGLFLVGDLFDFWFEYRHAIPKVTLGVSRALADWTAAGIPVIYLGGNHDFWAGPWLQRELGVRSFDDPIHARLQGRSVYLAHGDGLGPGDTGYKILRRLLHHPAAIAAYRILHPDLGIPFATFASHLSRSKAKLPSEELLPRVVRDVIRPALVPGVSAMVMGHLHELAHFQEQGITGTHDAVLLGDWIRHFSFARLRDGRFELCRWSPSGGIETVTPVAFPPMPTPGTR